MRICHYVLSLVIGLSITLADVKGFAADPQCESTEFWKLFGEVSFDLLAKRDGIEHRSPFRFVAFQNGEFLVEIVVDGIRKRALQLPASVSAYEGLATQEATGISGKNPFMFIEMVLYGVLGPLSSAFPCGIESVPKTAQQFKVTRDGAFFEGSAGRLSDDQVRYHLTMEIPGEKIAQVIGYDGVWSKSRVVPFPDDMSITGWRVTHKNLPVSGASTLGQVRSLSSVSSP
jgi:hypothetical protein